MTQEEAINEIDKDLSDFQYIGEILATIRYHEIASVSEVISYYYKLWELTEELTDEYLQRKEDEAVEINPGGYSHMTVKGRKNPFNIDALIESLRSQERYIETILGALREKYPKRFPRNSKFKQSLAPKP